jgi:tetratricopeptide (TPR) repeat protein
MRGFRLFSVIVIALSAFVAIASGKDKKDLPKDKSDPTNHAALSKPMAAVALGNAKFVAKDYAASLEAYKRAVQLAPNDPLGHYLVAEAQLAQGNINEGEAALAQAEKLGDKRPDVMGKVLFLEADTKERQKKWADAKTAWSKYSEWAQKHIEAGAIPTTGAARIAAIDEAMKLDTQYEDVRKRIADEKKGDAGK